MIIRLLSKEEKENSVIVYNDLRKKEIPDKSESEYYCEPQIPELPKWTNKINHCQQYQVNLNNLTCTCEDHKIRRESYGCRDVRLCCRHIYYKLTGSAASKHINSLYKNLSYAAAFLNINSFHTFNIDRRDIYYGFKEGLNWIQVFVPTRENDSDSYAGFSYNTELYRWSYGIEPLNAWKIVHILESIRKNMKIN